LARKLCLKLFDSRLRLFECRRELRDLQGLAAEHFLNALLESHHHAGM
jgi:hypothetical protein